MLDKERMSTIQERQDRGRALREQVPRSSHGILKPVSSRPDPINLLQEHDKNHLKKLLPIKYSRMLESPSAFMRGAAVVMAADLVTTPVIGLYTQLCGDAHLLNFGIFATPERKLVFDINDFDETYPGPWEWDLKRLTTSAVLIGREKGFGNDVNRELAMVVNRCYQKSIANFTLAPFLDVWYYDVEVAGVLEVFDRSSRKDRESVKKVVKKALYSTQEHTMEKLTEFVGGRRQIRNDPPLLVRLSETVPEEQEAWITELDAEKLFKEYIAFLKKSTILCHTFGSRAEPCGL